jgi:hypothetical protein
LVSEAELAQLFASFPGPEGSFDFKAFAERCYPREAAQGKIVDGRTVGPMSPSATAAAAQQSQSGPPSRPLTGSQQLYEQTQQQQQEQFEFEQQQQQQQQYEQQLFDEQQQQQSFQATQGQAQPASFGGATTLGGTYNPNGTTAYYREQGATVLAQQRSPQRRTAAAAAGAAITGGKASASSPKPRLTYNRPAHARWNETEFVGSSGGSNAFPRAAPYPAQELSSPSRFESKPLNPPRVEVPRRHNISRQYNRDGTAPTNTR